MGKLSILGAQRVKALQEILEEQKKAEIAVLKPKYPSRREVLSALESEYPGVTAAHDLITEVFQNEPSYSYRDDGPYQLKQKELTDEKQAERNAITAKYDDKARQLWLCETLEEAKAIVYGSAASSNGGNA